MGAIADRFESVLGGTPGSDFDANFNTVLSPAEERQFSQWKQLNAPNDSGHDYDLRGAFKAGLSPAGPEAGQDAGHWPDTFKKPNHPTFSEESRYAPYGTPGRWNGNQFMPPPLYADGGVVRRRFADGGTIMARFDSALEPIGGIIKERKLNSRDARAARHIDQSLSSDTLAADAEDDFTPGNIGELEAAIGKEKDPKAREILVAEHNRIKGEIPGVLQRSGLDSASSGGSAPPAAQDAPGGRRSLMQRFDDAVQQAAPPEAAAPQAAQPQGRRSLMDRFQEALDEPAQQASTPAAAAPAPQSAEPSALGFAKDVVERGPTPIGYVARAIGEHIADDKRAPWAKVLEGVLPGMVAAGKNAIANLGRMAVEEGREQRLEAEGETSDAAGYSGSAQFRALQKKASARNKAAINDAEIAGNDLKEWAKATKKKLELVTPEHMDTIQQGVWSFVQSAPPQALGLALGIVTRNPWIGGAIAGGGGAGMQAGQTYGEALDKGASHRLAAASAAIQGAIELSDFLPIGVALKPGSGFLKRLGMTSVTEGGTEALQQLLQDLQAMASYDPDMKMGEVWQNMKVAALAGMLGGVVFGTIGHIAQGKEPERPAITEDQAHAIRAQVAAIVNAEGMPADTKGGFTPSHRLDDGTDVAPHTEDGKPVPGAWVDAAGAVYDAPRAEPIQKPSPNATWATGATEYPVEVIGKGSAKGTARLADGQEIPITQLSLEDDAKAILGLLPAEDEVKKAPAKPKPQAKAEPKAPAPIQETAAKPAENTAKAANVSTINSAAPQQERAAAKGSEAEPPPPRGARPEAAAPLTDPDTVYERNQGRLKDWQGTRAVYFDASGEIVAIGAEKIPDSAFDGGTARTATIGRGKDGKLVARGGRSSPALELLRASLKSRELSQAELKRRDALREKGKEKHRLRRTPNAGTDSLINYITKLGGLDPAEQLDVTGDTKINPSLPFVGTLFMKPKFAGARRTRGHSLDGMAEYLVEAGYLQERDLNDLAARIRAEIAGTPQYSVHFDNTEQERQKAEIDEQYQAHLATLEKEKGLVDEMGALADDAPLEMDIAPEEIWGEGIEPSAESLVISDLLSQLDEDTAERLIMQYVDQPQADFIKALRAAVQEKANEAAADEGSRAEVPADSEGRPRAAGGSTLAQERGRYAAPSAGRDQGQSQQSARGEKAARGRKPVSQEAGPQARDRLTPQSVRQLLERLKAMDQNEKERMGEWIDTEMSRQAEEGREIADACLGRAGRFGI